MQNNGFNTFSLENWENRPHWLWSDVSKKSRKKQNAAYGFNHSY